MQQKELTKKFVMILIKKKHVCLCGSYNNIYALWCLNILNWGSWLVQMVISTNQVTKINVNCCILVGDKWRQHRLSFLYLVPTI